MSKLRIGISNRSSLLHVAGVSQLIEAGILNFKDYHGAKLYYETDLAQIFLSSGSNLCKLLKEEKLDYIFTGDDYVWEYLPKVVKRLPFKILKCRLALMASHNQLDLIENVYTKHTKSAKKYLKIWGYSNIKVQQISGGAESYCFLSPKNAIFDTICTGISKDLNNLYVFKETEYYYCSWFGNNEFPSQLKNVVKDKSLISHLKTIYGSLLYLRDFTPCQAIKTIFKIKGTDLEVKYELGN